MTTDELQQFHPAGKRRTKEGMNLNLVAMIDVVFLLLMYFLLATNFSQGEEWYRIKLPASLSSQGQINSLDLPEEPIVITINSVGADLSDYRIVTDLDNLEMDSFEELYQRMKNWNAGEGNSAGILFPDTPVIIKPHVNCRWDHAVNTLNACLRAGYENVHFVEPVE